MKPIHELSDDLLAGRGKYRDTEELATYWLAHDPTKASRALFRVLTKHPREYIVGTVIPLLAELSSRDEAWEKIVLASLKKKGRCPRPLVASLRSSLQRRTTNATYDSIATTEPLFNTHQEETRISRAKSGGASKTLRLDKKISSIRGFPELLFPQLSFIGGPTYGIIRQKSPLRIDFCGASHLYIFGIVIVAQWAKKVGFDTVRCENLIPSTREYLTTIGFFRYIEGAGPPPRSGRHGVELQPIGENVRAEELASQVVEIFDAHGYVGQGDKASILILLAEVIENTYRHAGINPSGCLAAQFYPKERKVSVAIVDTGIGIPESFEQGYNPELIGITKHADAIDRAMRPLVTSKPVSAGRDLGHAGYGLYIASELAVRNGGTILISSGSASVCRFRKIYKGVWQRRKETIGHSAWRGTVVCLLLDLNNLLDISEVYRALPAPEGFEDEDFFCE